MPHKRRNKYLSNGGEEAMNYGLNMSDEVQHENGEALPVKKRKNVHLQPLDHNPNSRNASVPPSGGIQGNAPHPLNFAPSPATGAARGNAGIRLQSIDHAQHLNMLSKLPEEDVRQKLPSPLAGGKRKQLEPLR